MRSVGLNPGVWFTDGANISMTPQDAGFAIAELEGPGDYDGIISKIGQLPACPKAVVTNFNTPLYGGTAEARQAAAPLISAGFTCLTEAYMGDNPNATPPNLDSYGRFLGWPTTQPVFGVYNKPLNEYTGYMNFPGWSAYLAEYLI